MTSAPASPTRTRLRGSLLRRTLLRRRSERGAALVEFAIVVPVLFLLIFGIIDFGVLYRDQLATRSGLRSTTRAAVIGRFGGSGTCTLESPTASNETLRQLMCNTKKQVGLSDDRVRVKVLLIDGNGDGAAEHRSYDDVMVCVMSQARSATGFFGGLLNSRAMYARLDMMIEKGVDEIPGLIPLEDAQETPLPGASWSFCDPSKPAP